MSKKKVRTRISLIAGQDKYGAFLLVGGFRSAMPDIEMARKLAAAPDMLEALKSAQSFLPPNPSNKNEIGNFIARAIAKATGGSDE